MNQRCDAGQRSTRGTPCASASPCPRSRIEQPSECKRERPDQRFTEGVRRDPDERRIAGRDGCRDSPSAQSSQPDCNGAQQADAKRTDQRLRGLDRRGDVSRRQACAADDREEQWITRSPTDRFGPARKQVRVVDETLPPGQAACEREILQFVLGEGLADPVRSAQTPAAAQVRQRPLRR